MNNEEMIWPILIGTVIGLIIAYLIILNAVKSGTEQIKKHIRMLNRANTYKLKREGFSLDQLHNMYYDEDDIFWERLRKEKTVEEQANFDQEVEKVKEYTKDKLP